MASNDRPTKAQRREEARRKAAELRRKQEREARRNKIIGIGLLVVAVLAIGAGIVAVVKHQSDVNKNKDKYADAAFTSDTPPNPADSVLRSDTPTPSAQQFFRPAAADPTLVGIPISSQGVGTAADGGVTVDVYMDFMCPWCGIFEQSQADAIQAVLAQDDVTVVYHMVTITNASSQGTYYASRAANAASVVADQDPDHFLAFVVAMMAEGTQPKEGTPGLTDEKIAQVAQGVGVPTAVTDQFTATADFQGTQLRTFVPWTAAVTSTFLASYSSTPTILVDGTPWSGWQDQTSTLSDAIDAARTGAAGDTPSDAATGATD